VISSSSDSTGGFGNITETVTVSATGDNNIDGLLFGSQWAASAISFSFTDSISDYESGYYRLSAHEAGFREFNAAQKATVRAWLGSGGASSFADVSGLRFIELEDDRDRDATLRIAMSGDPPTAYAYLPGPWVEAGDAWFGKTYYNQPVIGTYAHRSIGHELGHALGLKHGHELDGVRDIAMDADRNSMEFSIMTYASYVGHPGSGGYTNEAGGYSQSLMMYDIAAIQHMYGANFDYNSDDTTYTFSTSTGEMFINGVGQGTPYTNRIFRTIWDGDGIDTYDFSNYTTNLSIDLTPGGWSNLDTTGNFQRAYLGRGHYARGHVFNALQYKEDHRSLIENAYGGSGDDIIQGNTANNKLLGNDGNDTLYGDLGHDLLDGGAGADKLYGGVGNDRLYGGPGDDEYFVDSRHDRIIEYAEAGIDTVYSSASRYALASNVEHLYLVDQAANGYGNALDNRLVGNSSNNRLFGSGGHDELIGNGGHDRLYGGMGDDHLYGDDGNDLLNGGSGNDRLNGGTGDDHLNDSLGDNHLDGGSGDDTLSSGSGNDRLEGGSGHDRLFSGAGDDQLSGGLGDDRMYGGSGQDRLYGGSGDDLLNGGMGDDLMLGEAGNDHLNGESGNDEMDGGTGDDTLSSGPGNDRLEGGTGNDRLSAGAGDDLLYGGTDHDRLYAGAGDDLLWGGTGDDRLFGGAGDDILIGGMGKDILTGGSGADVYQYGSTAESSPQGLARDVLTDFRSGFDKIDLSRIDASLTLAGDQAFNFLGKSHFTGLAGEIRYYSRGSNLIVQAALQGDVNGLVAMEIQVNGVSSLVASDFIV
jgi:serralysin